MCPRPDDAVSGRLHGARPRADPVDRGAHHASGTGHHPPQLCRCETRQLRARRPAGLRGAWHRRGPFPDVDRLARGAGERGQLRLHQGHRRRRPGRPRLPRQLARRGPGRRGARGLSFLLPLPPGRRTGRLLHPQRAPCLRRASARSGYGMDTLLAHLHHSPRARGDPLRGEDLPRHRRGALRPAPDHLFHCGFLPRESDVARRPLSVLAALRRRPSR